MKNPLAIDRKFMIRAVLGCGLACVLLFASVMIFTYDFWPVAASTATLFVLSAATTVCWAAGWLPLATAGIFAAVVFPVFWGMVQLWTGQTVYRFMTWQEISGYAEAACAFWLALQIFQSERLRMRSRLWICAFGATFAIVSILLLYTSPSFMYRLNPVNPEEQIGMGPFENRDHYAAFIELLMPIAAWEALMRRGSGALFGVMTAIMYASVMATLSRAGCIIATLELLVVGMIALLRQRRERVRFATVPVVVATAVVAIIGSFAGLDLVLQRLEKKDQFAHRREYFWSSVEMTRTRPWFGYGLGTWPTVYPRFATFDPGTFANHAHNDWAEWAGEGGLPLVLAFFVIAVRSSWLAWKFPAALGLVAVFLHNAVDFNMREHPIPLFLMAVLGWAEASVRHGDMLPSQRRRKAADDVAPAEAQRERSGVARRVRALLPAHALASAAYECKTGWSAIVLRRPEALRFPKHCSQTGAVVPLIPCTSRG
jgi:O-antigen ligase